MENLKAVSNLYNHHVKFVDKESKKVKSCPDPEEAKVAMEVVVVVVVVEGIGVSEAKSQGWHIFLTDSNFLTFTVYLTSEAKS